ncbi:FAD binding domain protein [Aspergillus flavus]|nr:FAD binding domain protein [Aspergillus flavus]
MAPPKSAIIIGGSISGLLQALQLKRAGTDVLILEQDPSPTRASHESGVSIGPSVLALLKKYDATGTPPAIPAGFLSVAWQTRPRVLNTAWHHDMSNWGSLYLILRANVDGFASDVVPYPPPGRKGDGTAEYKAGRRVVGVEFDRGDGAMNVLHVEVEASRGSRQGMEVKRERAEMVIAADGVHSTIRRFLQVPTTWTYAGYIAWRGTVREDQLSPETGRISSRISFHRRQGLSNQEGGSSIGSGTTRSPEGSVAMDTIFTDINGVLHNSTVPGDLLDPKVWSVQKRRYISDGTTPHLTEAVSQTRRPFVTKVGEVEASAASYFDGRLVLVGDAFATFRSHLGLASEQAARHCLQMDRVWSGEISQAARDREARLYAAKLLLLNRLMGFLGLGWWWSALKTGLAYACLLITCRVVDV